MNGWTIVTGFFSLNESPKEYINRCKFTLGIASPMMIYTDPSMYYYIKSIREPFETKIRQIKLKELPYYQYIDRIKDNRHVNNLPGSPEYFILMMSKFTMLMWAMTENPHNSNMFMWINPDYSQPDADYNYITEILDEHRDRFSCCLIDYIPQKTVESYKIFNKVISTGILTSDQLTLRNICRLIDEEFKNIIKSGYGYTDEQVLYLVFLKNIELFNFYVGDHHCLLKNYKFPRDISTTEKYLIPNVCVDYNIELLNKIKKLII